MQNLNPIGQGSGHQLTPGQLRHTGWFPESFSLRLWLHRVKPCPAAWCFHYQFAWPNPKWTTSAGLCHKHALAGLCAVAVSAWTLTPFVKWKDDEDIARHFYPTPKQSHSSLRLHNPRILHSAGSNCQPPDHRFVTSTCLLKTKLWNLPDISL